MAWNRPTLPDLIDTIRTNLVTRMSITTTVLRRSVVRILATVFANEAHDLHGHLEYNSQQIFASTADADNLVSHGNDLETPQKPATYASGPVDITGAPDGTVLSAESIFQRDDGVQYETLADAVIAGGVAVVQVEALEAGADGNADAGTALTLITSTAGIVDAAVVDAAGIDGGVDLEDVELWRQRILDRKSAPPASGNASDYKRWALSISGVTRCWPVDEGAGAGTVQVYIMADDADDGPFADAGIIAAVQALLDDDDHHVMASHVYVVTPAAHVLNPTIHIVPDTPANRAAVTAEIQDLVLRSQDPNGVTIPLSQIEAAVENAEGVNDSVVSVPAGAFVSATGQIATFGVITWV